MFTFWTFINGVRVEVPTNSLLSAARMARELGGTECFGLNPGTNMTFKV